MSATGTIVQISHHDLDGYGATTVVGAFCAPSRVVHVPRYADVGPVVEEELRRLSRSQACETLIMTDLGLEGPTVGVIRKLAALNRRREEGTRHRLIVLDHHASSIDRLREQNLEPQPVPERARLKRFDLDDPGITVLIDEDACATRMAYEQRALFATHEADPALAQDLEALVEAVDALDLWRKDAPAFAGGLALDEAFWDNVGGVVPADHPWHDGFVSGLLLAAAARLRAGVGPAGLETEIPALRRRVVDRLLRDEPEDDPGLTTRMRVARALSRSDALFHGLSDGTLLSFALDAGTFQRVSDLVMARGRAKRLVNVQRMGSLSFRSIDGTALDGARVFRGGGHRDAAGGKLPSGSAFSRADAVAQVEPLLNPPPPDRSGSPFAALKDWKG